MHAQTSLSSTFIMNPFPQEKSLKGDIINLSQDLFCAFPSQIELYDSIVLILDMRVS